MDPRTRPTSAVRGGRNLHLRRSLPGACLIELVDDFEEPDVFHGEFFFSNEFIDEFFVDEFILNFFLQMNL